VSDKIIAAALPPAVDKTLNMEHSGISRNIPEYPGTLKIMRKICKINFSKIKLNKNKLVSVWKIKSKTKTLQT